MNIERKDGTIERREFKNLRDMLDASEQVKGDESVKRITMHGPNGPVHAGRSISFAALAAMAMAGFASGAPMRMHSSILRAPKQSAGRPHNGAWKGDGVVSDKVTRQMRRRMARTG